MFELDVTGLNSPLPVLRLKKALARVDNTENVEIILNTDVDENVRDISSYIKMADKHYTICIANKDDGMTVVTLLSQYPWNSQREKLNV